MAKVKGYCKHCPSNDIHHHIFDLNDTAPICYCPRCMSKMTPEEAIKNMTEVLDSYLIGASRLLYSINDYEASYKAYGDILDLDESSVYARYGRIISLIRLSTLRNSRFKDSLLLFKEESNIYFHLEKNYISYLTFIRLLNSDLDEYLEKCYKKLSLRTYFYDSKCLYLMITRLKETLEFKQFILDELNFIAKDENLNKDVSHVIEKVNDSINKINEKLNDKYTIACGFSYKLIDFSKDGTPVMGKDENIVNTKLGKYNMATLSTKDKKRRTIKDQIYRDNTKIDKASKGIVPFLVISILISSLFVITYFFNNKNDWFDLSFIPYIGNYSLIAVSGLFFIIFIIQLILLLVWKKKLKGTTFYRINPLIFK